MPNSNRSFHGELGTSLAETLVVLCLLGLGLTVSVPSFTTIRHALAMNSTSRRITALMVRARVTATAEGRACSLVFERRGRGWECFIARDNDGDGVNRRDLAAGVDEILGERIELTDRPAGLGILRGFSVPDPSGRGRLEGNLDDPIRAGRGDIVTFTRDATATPCSIYITDHRSRMRVIRLFGPTARFRVLEWRRGWTQWQPAGW